MSPRCRAWIRAGLAVTAVLLAAQCVRRSALSVFLAGAPPTGVSLQRSDARLWFSPILSLIEQVSLLPARAHIALIWSVIVLAFLLGAGPRSLRSGFRAGVRRGAARSALALAALLLIYAVGALVPLPMATLRHDADEVAVDFHSHTSRSHDGRWDFSLAHNAEWHRGGGFDVAYVTDHADSASTSSSIAATSHASYAPVLLDGAEFTSAGAHVVRLGEAGERSSVLILTEPFPQDAVPRLRAAGTRIAAIEALDASPRGLQWMIDHPNAARRNAVALGAAEVAVSNQHGWGSTVAAWTLVRIPGWQHLTGADLDAQIRTVLRRGESSRLRIVRRRAPIVSLGTVSTLLTLPIVCWSALRALAPSEVAIWLLWIWAPALALFAREVLAGRRRALELVRRRAWRRSALVAEREVA